MRFQHILKSKYPELFFALFVFSLPVLSTLVLGLRTNNSVNYDFRSIATAFPCDIESILIFKNEKGTYFQLSDETENIFLPKVSDKYYKSTLLDKIGLRLIKPKQYLSAAFDLLQKDNSRHHIYIAFDEDTKLEQYIGQYLVVCTEKIKPIDAKNTPQALRLSPERMAY